jgi:mono/diheme cytochrome c family protein
MPKAGMRRSLYALIALAVFITAALQSVTVFSSSTHALSSTSFPAQATREPGMMFDPTDRLAPPPMSDPPTQVEQGHYAYYLSCMVCHGDRGQGLTEEWRGALDPADRNCWQSRCHAPNHPPEGFELPHHAPPLIGPGKLAHYQTAARLYEFIHTRMPWQAPGILSDEEYWQLTAFLVDANGIPLGEIPLGPENAANLQLAPPPFQGEASAQDRQATSVWYLLLAAGTVVLFASGVVTLWRRNRIH